MKNLFIITAAIVGFCCNNQPAISQTEWEVGNTTLTETDLVTGVELPWEILWGPDDHIWCTTRPGEVLRIDPSTGNYTTVLDLTDVIFEEGESEPGMLGMTLHPDFLVTPKVFIVYCYGNNSVSERLSVFDWDGAQLVNEQYVIDDIPGYYIHDGSRLIISPDGKILMTTGDTGDGGDSSQDIEALNGKVLRINLDGSIPADNPDPSSYVWSWGHRNGQGLCVGPNNIIYESEHGQNASDEFNIIEVGRNYGWPTVQGVCNTAAEQTFCTENNVKEPLKEWSPCVAVNGIEYYNHEAIPEWQNSVLMGVMGGLGGANNNYDRVSVLHMSADGLTVESEDQYFTSLNQRFRDVCVNPYTGAVYVALNGSQYPGNGPNKIKEFRNLDYNTVQEMKPNASQSMNVFPNPAGDSMTVEISESLVGSMLEIFSNNGNLVKEVKLQSKSTKLDLSEFKAGNYWIKTTSPLGTLTKTFVKN